MVDPKSMKNEKGHIAPNERMHMKALTSREEQRNLSQAITAVQLSNHIA